MNQRTIDLCIKNKPIFDKYLKERGFRVGDLICFNELAKQEYIVITSNKTFGGNPNVKYITLNATMNNQTPFIITVYENTKDWFNLIWCPQPNDLEKIIMDKLNCKNIVDLMYAYQEGDFRVGEITNIHEAFAWICGVVSGLLIYRLISKYNTKEIK